MSSRRFERWSWVSLEVGWLQKHEESGGVAGGSLGLFVLQLPGFGLREHHTIGVVVPDVRAEAALPRVQGAEPLASAELFQRASEPNRGDAKRWLRLAKQQSERCSTWSAKH